MSSSWSRPGAALLAVVAVLMAWPSAPLAAQADDLDATCESVVQGPDAECFLAAAAVRLIHPRVGIGLWGGNPVPGSASTLGMRLGSVPRVSSTGRLVMVPIELPPLRDRAVGESTRGMAFGASTQVTVGVLTGWSPLPTVGGLLSLDVTGRASLLTLPVSAGFEGGPVLGWSAGARLGLLRESFTMPGLSLTGSYGRSSSFSYGASDGTDQGYIEGAVSALSAKAVASKRVGPAGLLLGASMSRYSSTVDFSYATAPSVGQTAAAATDRWAVFANLSWTLLIFNASVEAGWQEAPVPTGLPGDVSINPTGWWVGAGFRTSL